MKFETKKKKARPVLIVGLKYGGVMRLVTRLGEERLCGDPAYHCML
jgi:hypothetical protein